MASTMSSGSSPDNAKPPKGGFVYEPPVIFPPDKVEDDYYREAWHGMIDRKMCQSRKYKEQQWRGIRVGAHPAVLRHGNLLVGKMHSLGVPVFMSEIIRSNERQNQLYKDGFSKAKAGKGPHPYGLAYDLVHSVHGWNLSAKQWEFIGHVGKWLAISYALPIDWGGDWPPLKDKVGWDPAHWQLRKWRQVMSDYPWPPFNKHGYGTK